MASEKAYTCISLDDVVKSILKKQSTKDFHRQVAQAAQYYGNCLLQEDGQVIITEEAQVISIETVCNPQ